jgi:hypothetical protein
VVLTAEKIRAAHVEQPATILIRVDVVSNRQIKAEYSGAEITLLLPHNWELREDSDLFLWLYSPLIAGSGILIDVARVDWVPQGARDHLGRASEHFLNESVLQTDKRPVSDISSAYWETDYFSSVRTTVNMEDGYNWVFQFVFLPSRQLSFILHWNGPHSVLNDIIPVFDSLTVRPAGAKE